LYLREAMRTKIAALPASGSLKEILRSLNAKHRQSQRLLPVVHTTCQLAGVITHGEIRERLEREGGTLLSQTLQELCAGGSGRNLPGRARARFGLSDGGKRSDANAGRGAADAATSRRRERGTWKKNVGASRRLSSRTIFLEEGAKTGLRLLS